MLNCFKRSQGYSLSVIICSQKGGEMYVNPTLLTAMLLEGFASCPNQPHCTCVSKEEFINIVNYTEYRSQHI